MSSYTYVIEVERDGRIRQILTPKQAKEIVSESDNLLIQVDSYSHGVLDFYIVSSTAESITDDPIMLLRIKTDNFQDGLAVFMVAVTHARVVDAIRD
jgi:hypothetical protein